MDREGYSSSCGRLGERKKRKPLSFRSVSKKGHQGSEGTRRIM